MKALKTTAIVSVGFLGDRATGYELRGWCSYLLWYVPSKRKILHGVLTEMPLPSGEVQGSPPPLVRQGRVRPGPEEHLDHLHVAPPGGQADGLFVRVICYIW